MSPDPNVPLTEITKIHEFAIYLQFCSFFATLLGTVLSFDWNYSENLISVEKGCICRLHEQEERYNFGKGERRFLYGSAALLFGKYSKNNMFQENILLLLPHSVIIIKGVTLVEELGEDLSDQPLTAVTGSSSAFLVLNVAEEAVHLPVGMPKSGNF